MERLLSWFVLIYISTDVQICSIDPGAYRAVNELVQSHTRGQGVVEIASVKNVEAGDVAL